MKPGLYPDIPEAVYHADPCETPSLSSSVACVIIDQSLLHAYRAHPRLGDNHEVVPPTRPIEIGSAAHALILGVGRQRIEVVAGDAYRTDAAKAQRSASYEAGRQPILQPDYDTALELTGCCVDQLMQIEGCKGFFDGQPELTGIVQDATGAWLRARFDMLEERNGRAIIWDIKTGQNSAHPAGLGKRIANMSYEIQAAFYERVLVQLRPDLAGRITFRWVFVENDVPHLIQVSEVDATGLEIGRRKVAAAIGLWHRAMQTGEWPGYPQQIIMADYPPFAESAWLNREEQDEAVLSLPPDPILCVPVDRPITPIFTDTLA